MDAFGPGHALAHPVVSEYADVVSDPLPEPQPVVLVAEDDALVREFVADVLTRRGIKVVLAENGQQALERGLQGGIDLVLLDVVMPGMGGMECCRLLKSETREVFLPVVLVTVRNDTESRIEGLRIGADDYIGKPFDARELLERVNSLIRIKRMHDDLAEAKLKLERLAVHDELTGLYNYRYLHTRLMDEFKRAERYQAQLGCAMIDIDHFKQINDRHGHDVGDNTLREVSRRLQANVRELDVVARYGGEEFLVILPHTAGSGAALTAERMRTAIAGANVEVLGHSLTVTVSIGVAVYPSPSIQSKDALVKAADAELYRAKAQGRNVVCRSDVP